MRAFLKLFLFFNLLCFVGLNQGFTQQSSKTEPIFVRCSRCVKNFLDDVVTVEAKKDEKSKVILIGRAKNTKVSSDFVKRNLKFFKNYLSNAQKLGDRILQAHGEMSEASYVNSTSGQVGQIEFYIKGELIGIIPVKRIKLESDNYENCPHDLPCFEKIAKF
ncbi:MAG: hypothetical protein M3209_19070 [Acidobacteriota bacterium]|nr:hypothetical protein [Acidobacteriota bacterium]